MPETASPEDAAKEQLARLESPWAKSLGHFDDPQLLGGAATDYCYPPTMPLGRHFAGVGQVVCRSG